MSLSRPIYVLNIKICVFNGSRLAITIQDNYQLFISQNTQYFSRRISLCSKRRRVIIQVFYTYWQNGRYTIRNRITYVR